LVQNTEFEDHTQLKGGIYGGFEGKVTKKLKQEETTRGSTLPQTWIFLDQGCPINFRERKKKTTEVGRQPVKGGQNRSANWKGRQKGKKKFL